MARQGLSRLLVVVAVLAAGLAWMGFTFERTLFEPSRSGRVVRVLLDSPEVRHQLVQGVVDTVDSSLPAEVRGAVSLPELTAVADATLDDPAVRAAIEQSLVGTQRYLIGDTETVPTLDTALIDAKLRAQLAAANPQLAAIVPTLPPLQIDLPAAGVSPVRKARSLVEQVTPLLALVALIAAVGALIVAPDRGKVLRRLGGWAFSVGAIWVVLRFGLPALAKAVLPADAAIVTALSEAVSGSMAGPGVALAMTGVVLYTCGGLLGYLQRQGSSAEARRRAEQRAAQRATKRQEAAEGREAARAAKAAKADRDANAAKADRAANAARADRDANAGKAAAAASAGTAAAGAGAGARAATPAPLGHVPSGGDDPGIYRPPAGHPGAPGMASPGAHGPASGPAFAGGAAAGTAAVSHPAPYGPQAANGPNPAAGTAAPAAHGFEPQHGHIAGGAAGYGHAADTAVAHPAQVPANPPRHNPTTGAAAVGGQPPIAASPVFGKTPAGQDSGLNAEYAPTISIPLPKRERGNTAAPAEPVAATAAGAQLDRSAPEPATSSPAAHVGGPAEPPVPAPAARGNAAALTLGAGPGGTHGPGGAHGPGEAAAAREVPKHTPSEWLGGFSMDPEDHQRIADPAPPPPRWIEGVGYVYEYAPTPTARWIDGLGYVLGDE